MKKQIFTTALMIFSAGAAFADPAVLLGGTIRFGGGSQPAFGLTAKVISDDKADEFVAGLGVSWFPGNAQAFGLDASAGYLFDDTAALLGYDFLGRSPTFSLGYVDTDEENSPAAPVEEPPVEALAAQ